MMWGAILLVSAAAQMSPAASGPSKVRFLGLAAASHASFTTSPGGCAMSILYDRASVSWNNGAPDPKRMPELVFRPVTGAARPAVVRVDLRGNLSGPADARLSILFGKDLHELRVTQGEFHLHASARLGGADATLVKVTLNLARPDDGQAVMLALDSIDMALPACSAHPAGH